jgi:serine O-acetyltransferase
MRYVEYYGEKKNLLSRMAYVFFLRKLRKISYKTGIQIPPFVFGPGITIWHWGSIVVNAQAKIGSNCVMHPDITIGQKNSHGGSPIIGDDVTIGSGARIIGEVHIGNDVIIGTNTVITKNIPPHSVVVGNPARIIKTRKSINEEWEYTNILL